MPTPPEIVSQFAQSGEALGQLGKAILRVVHGGFPLEEKLNGLGKVKQSDIPQNIRLIRRKARAGDEGRLH
jgi:hypothetical protein